MRVRHLSLSDFRSYPSADVDLGPGVTTFVGLNGQGKTNLVEAIGYLSTLSSHRVAQDTPLVRFGSPQAVIRAAVLRAERESSVDLEIVPGRANRARLNRSACRPRDVLGTLRTVIFAPEDLSLVKGDPSERRRFLDELLVQRQPRWAGVRSDYDKILKQRNALLKSAAQELRRDLGGRRRNSSSFPQVSSTGLSTPSNQSGYGRPTGMDTPPGETAPGSPGPAVTTALETLDIWDEQLSTIGAQLTYARLRLVRDLAPFLSEAYDAVSESASGARAVYRSSLDDQTAEAIASGAVPELEELRASMRATLADRRRAEVERGVTLAGPHRDDLQLHLGELPAKGYASHGESWSFALGLKLAAYALLRRDLDTDPVLILDDVFAELDARRRLRLADLVADGEQVLITAAVPQDIPGSLSGERFVVTKGTVTREGRDGTSGTARPDSHDTLTITAEPASGGESECEL